MAGLTQWLNQNIGDPNRRFITPNKWVLNQFSNAKAPVDSRMYSPYSTNVATGGNGLSTNPVQVQPTTITPTNVATTQPQKGTVGGQNKPKAPLTAKNNPVGAVQAEAASVPVVAGSVDFNRPTGLSSLGMSGKYTPMNTTDLSGWGDGMSAPYANGLGSGSQNTFNPLYSSGYTGASDPYNAFSEAGYTPNANVLTGSATGSVYTPGMYAENNPEYVAAMNNTVTPDSNNWWTENKDMIGGVAQGIQGLSGLANAYMGYKNYGLAKDQFGFEKAATNRAIQNQASEYNTGIQNAGEVGMSLAGNTMSPAQRAAYQQTLDSRKISTAPVG